LNATQNFADMLHSLSFGDHLGLIYRNPQEQFAAIIPCIKHGLDRGEKCLYVVAERTAQEVKEALERAGVDVQGYLDSGQLGILSQEGTLVSEGHFEPDKMIALLTEKTDAALREGFTGLRLAAEMSCTLTQLPGSEELNQYEARLNEPLRGSKAVVICQYNETCISPELLLGVLATHPLVIVHGQVCRNFYYVPPDELLQGKRDPKVESARYLQNLKEREQLELAAREHSQALARKVDKLTTLYAIDRAAAQSLDLDEILNNTLDTTLEVLEVESGGIYLLEPSDEAMTLRVHRGLSEESVTALRQLQLGEGISDRAVAQGKPVILDVPDYPAERLTPFVVREGFQSLASAPLLSAGKPVGALTLATRRPRAFSQGELELLAAIGQQLGGAVANARLHHETKQRATHLAILNRIARAVNATLNLDELLEMVYQEVTAVLPADAFFIALYDRETNELDFRIRVDRAVREPPERRPLRTSLTALVVTSGQPVLVRDFEREKDHLPPVKLWGTMQTPASWLGVPMLLADQVIGVISVQAYRAAAYDEEKQQLLTTITDQVALAVENARLYETERQARQVAEALRDATATLAGSLELDQVMEGILDAVQRVIPHDAANIALISGDKIGFARWRGYERFGVHPPVFGPGLRIADAFNYRYMAETGRPRVVFDTAADPEWIQVPGWEWLRSYVAVPIRVRETLIGFLNLDSATPNFFSPEHARLLATFANHIAVAIENAWLYTQTQQRLAELSTLFEVSSALRGAVTGEELLSLILQKTIEVMQADAGDIYLLDRARGDLVCRVASERLKELRSIRLRLGEGITGFVVETGQPYVSLDLLSDSRFPDRPELQAIFQGLHSNVCVPLKTAEAVIGAMHISSLAPRTFTNDEVRLLTTIADMAASAIHRVTLFENLQEAYQRLQVAQAEAVKVERLRALGQMASGIVHDFNNLLTPILGYISLVLGDRTLPPTAQADLEQARRGAQSAAQVIDRLREFYRQRDVRAIPLPVDLNHIIQQTLDITQPRWKDIPQQQGISINVKTELASLPAVPGEASELRELLTNLIFNAVDAMPHGGTLTVRTTVAGEWVTLQVRDTGVGMSQETQAHLFEPFFTTKGDRGTGLGLATVYGIVQRHQGRIEVESAPGQGSTFTIHLSLKGEMAAPQVAEVEVPFLPSLSVLLIDDNEAVRRVVLRMLEAFGHRVTPVGSGAEGLAAVENDGFDVVITDLGMPGMSGAEVARRVKAQTPQMPVILLTGWGEGIVEESSVPLYIDAVVGKPLTAHTLQQTLANVLVHR
jgi:GAF domain-containing protein/CheY-like chemotaxis protein